jgi:hypothetical protein
MVVSNAVGLMARGFICAVVARRRWSVRLVLSLGRRVRGSVFRLAVAREFTAATVLLLIAAPAALALVVFASALSTVLLPPFLQLLFLLPTLLLLLLVVIVATLLIGIVAVSVRLLVRAASVIILVGRVLSTVATVGRSAHGYRVVLLSSRTVSSLILSVPSTRGRGVREYDLDRWAENAGGNFCQMRCDHLRGRLDRWCGSRHDVLYGAHPCTSSRISPKSAAAG